MSWMFRWLDQLLSRLRRQDYEAHALERGWVEPSNAITRAILNGTVAQLATTAFATSAAGSAELESPMPEFTESIATFEPARDAPAIVTRTAQRTRRRRATRAA